jgi:hypothetical protein
LVKKVGYINIGLATEKENPKNLRSDVTGNFD